MVLTFRNTELATAHPLGSFLADLWRVPNASRVDLDGISPEEADELADSIAVVDHGKIIARGTADQGGTR